MYPMTTPITRRLYVKSLENIMQAYDAHPFYNNRFKSEYDSIEEVIATYRGTTLYLTDYYTSYIPKLHDNKYYKMCLPRYIESITNIPEGLLCLTIDESYLTTLPKLPDSLEMLSCRAGRLTSLPELPTSLVYLSCSCNRLETLPDLSKCTKLRYIDCSFNPIQTINLDSLPVSLTTFICNDTPIESLIDRTKYSKEEPRGTVTREYPWHAVYGCEYEKSDFELFSQKNPEYEQIRKDVTEIFFDTSHKKKGSE